MVKGWKAKRHLALYVSVALSCGGGYYLLDSPYVYGADVTGGNVVVDGTSTHPLPSIPIAGGVISNTSDAGNVYGNELKFSSG